VAKGHGFANVKYETLSLSQWKQKHLQWHCEIMQSIFHHRNKNESESPLNLKAAKKQWINLKTKTWGKPNLLCKQRRKHLRPNGMMGCMGKQKAMHPPLDPLGLQACVMWIKSHVKNDTKQGMVAPYLKCSFQIDLLPSLQIT
jgi:hypothetical protein